jgi:hypothetical protein
MDSLWYWHVFDLCTNVSGHDTRLTILSLTFPVLDMRDGAAYEAFYNSQAMTG